MSKNSLFAIFIGLFYAITYFSGGDFLSFAHRTLLISILSLIILGVAFWRLRFGLPNRASYFAFILLLVGISLMALQTVPLPPQIWSNLPGRAFISEDFATLGLSGQWMPLSLSYYETKQDIISLLPAFAVFFGILSLSAQNWRFVTWATLGVALISTFIGLVQRFQGTGGIFNFYHLPYNIFASGFFSNRNFFAAQLYCAVPFLAAMVLQGVKGRSPFAFVWPIFGLACLVALIAGVGASSSRMGVVFVVLALLSIPFLYLSSKRTGARSTGRGSLFLVVGLFVGIVVFAQLTFSALLRFSKSDIASDYRGTMFDISLKTLKNFFPFGSGFGSFVPAYQLFETPDIVFENYVNHAHNDWLELLLEGGLPMGIILLGFLAWFFYRSHYVWRKVGVDLMAKAAMVSASLLLMHSLLDFPLRTPVLMTFFGMCCGMMAASALRVGGQTRVHNVPSKNTVPQEPVPFRQRPGGFSGKNVSE
jgi:O-antigen ligase